MLSELFSQHHGPLMEVQRRILLWYRHECASISKHKDVGHIIRRGEQACRIELCRIRNEKALLSYLLEQMGPHYDVDADIAGLHATPSLSPAISSSPEPTQANEPAIPVLNAQCCARDQLPSSTGLTTADLPHESPDDHQWTATGHMYKFVGIEPQDSPTTPSNSLCIVAGNNGQSHTEPDVQEFTSVRPMINPSSNTASMDEMVATGRETLLHGSPRELNSCGNTGEKTVFTQTHAAMVLLDLATQDRRLNRSRKRYGNGTSDSACLSSIA